MVHEVTRRAIYLGHWTQPIQLLDAKTMNTFFWDKEPNSGNGTSTKCHTAFICLFGGFEENKERPKKEVSNQNQIFK